MNLEGYMTDCRRRVDAFFESRLQASDGRLARLFEAMRYSLLAGGKRIRPVLTFAAFEALSPSHSPTQPQQDAVLRVAAALEMIHTYSLIHDDLPSMDNDDLRRGRPTNHKVFGESMAILAGDSLLTEAFSVISGVGGVGADGIASETIQEIIRDIAEAAGGQGMAGGQALDLEYEGRKITLDELEFLHRHKTGRLIEVSVTSGAKLAGAVGTSLEAIKTYGEAIGLAFQIADDILDVEGGAEELGKTTGGDARKEKATYPAILGLEQSRRRSYDLAETAVRALAGLDHRADPLREIARFVVNRRL